MEILRDAFTKSDLSKETSYEYSNVLDLHNRIKSACKATKMNISEVASTLVQMQENQN